MKTKDKKTKKTKKSLSKEISTMKKDLISMRKKLNVYINRQFSEIRVKEKDGKWGDYTGVFYLSPGEEKKALIKKAKTHVNTFFKNSVWHRNKHLGLFITNKKREKQLIEEITTGE